VVQVPWFKFLELELSSVKWNRRIVRSNLDSVGLKYAPSRNHHGINFGSIRDGEKYLPALSAACQCFPADDKITNTKSMPTGPQARPGPRNSRELEPFGRPEESFALDKYRSEEILDLFKKHRSTLE
jgi:hypothetical protein